MERFIERFRYKATKARQAQSRVKKLSKIERIERDPRDGQGLEFAFTRAGALRAGRVRADRALGRGGRWEMDARMQTPPFIPRHP